MQANGHNEAQDICTWFPNLVLENLLSCLPSWLWWVKEGVLEKAQESFTRSYLAEGRHQQSLPFGRVLLAVEIVLALGRLHGVSAEPGNSSDPLTASSTQEQRPPARRASHKTSQRQAGAPPHGQSGELEPPWHLRIATHSRAAAVAMLLPVSCQRLCYANSRVLC